MTFDDLEKRVCAAVDGVVRDILGRRGLRHEFESIDEDIQEEIKATWTRIILDALEPK